MSEAEIIDVRILAHWIDDPTESPISIDARVNAPAKRIIGKWTIFGATCMDTRQCRPFALDADGAMDFGAGRGENERYWRTDVRLCEIAVGATFKVVWTGGDEGSYVIDKVARLGSKGG